MVALLICVGVAAWQLPPLVAPATVTFRAAARCVTPHCSGSSDDEPMISPELVEAIPPGQLADAWQREEKAKQLSEELKGCSLYVVGLGPRKTAVGRVLARRLARYRCYDVSTLMTSTYQQLAGQEEGAEPITLAKLLTSEPLEDVEQLASAVLMQVQAFSRSVFVTWDGAVSTADYAVMQQGLVVHLKQEDPEGTALPAEGAEEALEKWQAGHKKADVTVRIEDTDAADDAAFQV